MQRTLMAAYGIAVYLAFLAVVAYAVGFVEGMVVPSGIDDGPPTATWVALTIDVGLLALFAAQHSGMARAEFKDWWTEHVPAPVERSTYVLLATATLALLMWQWRPLPTVVWEVSSAPWRAIVRGVSFAGWGILLFSTFLIDHWHLFGLRQVLRHRRGEPPADPPFRTRSLYRVVRHPLLLGFLVAFWAAPTMTLGHVVFAAGMTIYALVGARLEERDLVEHFGDRYRRYQTEVPMILPTGRR